MHTGRASSTPIFDIRMNDRLKYLTALAASSGVLYPMYPILRCAINFASVTGNFPPKCFLNSSSDIVGGSPLTNMREDSMACRKVRGIELVQKHECKNECYRKVMVARASRKNNAWGPNRHRRPLVAQAETRPAVTGQP